MKANDNLKKLLSIENGFVAKKGMTLVSIVMTVTTYFSERSAATSFLNTVSFTHFLRWSETEKEQLRRFKNKRLKMHLCSYSMTVYYLLGHLSCHSNNTVSRCSVLSSRHLSLTCQMAGVSNHRRISDLVAGNQNVFKIQSPGKTITVYTRELQEKLDWMKDINDTRDKQMEIEGGTISWRRDNPLGAKMVFKLLKKEEERMLLERIKSEAKDIKSALPKNPHSAGTQFISSGHVSRDGKNHDGV